MFAVCSLENRVPGIRDHQPPSSPPSTAGQQHHHQQKLVTGWADLDDGHWYVAVVLRLLVVVVLKSPRYLVYEYLAIVKRGYVLTRIV